MGTDAKTPSENRIVFRGRSQFLEFVDLLELGKFKLQLNKFV